MALINNMLHVKGLNKEVVLLNIPTFDFSPIKIFLRFLVFLKIFTYKINSYSSVIVHVERLKT